MSFGYGIAINDICNVTFESLLKLCLQSEEVLNFFSKNIIECANSLTKDIIFTDFDEAYKYVITNPNADSDTYNLNLIVLVSSCICITSFQYIY